MKYALRYILLKRDPRLPSDLKRRQLLDIKMYIMEIYTRLDISQDKRVEIFAYYVALAKDVADDHLLRYPSDAHNVIRAFKLQSSPIDMFKGTYSVQGSEKHRRYILEVCADCQILPPR